MKNTKSEIFWHTKHRKVHCWLKHYFEKVEGEKCLGYSKTIFKTYLGACLGDLRKIRRRPVKTKFKKPRQKNNGSKVGVCTEKWAFKKE